jgi:hypothetical protein
VLVGAGGVRLGGRVGGRVGGGRVGGGRVGGGRVGGGRGGGRGGRGGRRALQGLAVARQRAEAEDGLLLLQVVARASLSFRC